MDEDDEDRFIPGVYNYCDRWCERCRFEDRCRVRHQEREMFERHLLRGEDPDDPQVLMQDVQDNFRKTIEMLHEMAAEMGIDLENCPPVERELDPHEDPLFQRAMRWSDSTEALQQRVGQDMPERARELTERYEAGELGNGAAALGEVAAIRDAWEILDRYHFFIPVKIARAISGLEHLDRVGREFSDALGTAKLAHDCIGRAVSALWRIGEFHRPWLDEAMPCILEGEALRREIDARFPGHQSFRRPGFDDEPESE